MRRTAAKWTVVSAATTAAALTLVLSALADKEQIHLTAADQAAARAAVVRKVDLGTATGWTGGSLKPDLSSSPPCATFDPKQSDLVLTGAARSQYKHAGLVIDSEAQVLQTAQMVKLDWQRSVLAPGLLPCLRTIWAKAGGSSTRLVSVRPLNLPHVGQSSYAVRIVANVTTAQGSFRMFTDLAFVVQGRTELSLVTSAALVADAIVRPAELKLLKVLVSRAQA